MKNQSKEIYVEVYSILNLLGEEYINKLPKSLYSMIENNVIDKNKFKYKSLTDIKEDNILKDSINMIALFHLNYWCESEEEKKELNLLFEDNRIENEKLKMEKYNPDDIFKDKVSIKENIENSNLPIEIKKEKFYIRFINFLKKLISLKK